MNKRKYIEKLFVQEKYLNETEAKFGSTELILVLDHLKDDYNIGKIFRSAEVFQNHEVHLIGTTFFDATPAKGCFRKLKAFFFKTFDESYRSLVERGYEIFAMDPSAEIFLSDVKFPKNSALIVGHEEFGPQIDFTKYPDIKKIKIMQLGVTNSLNVSIAASIGAYEYIRQHISGNS